MDEYKSKTKSNPIMSFYDWEKNTIRLFPIFFFYRNDAIKIKKVSARIWLCVVMETCIVIGGETFMKVIN